MSLAGGIRKAIGGAGAALGGVLTLDSSAGWDWTEDNIGLSRDKAMKVSTVNRCVEIRSCTMAMLPVYVMNERTKAREADHPVFEAIGERPNEIMSRFDYERLMGCNLDLKGNAYAWIGRDRRTGRPVELIPLQPDHVTPYLDIQGQLWYIYRNPRTGELFKLYPADVLHYRGYSTDGIEGISILKRAAQTIQTGLEAGQYQLDMYRNGGRPSGVLTVATDMGGQVEVAKEDGTIEKVDRKEVIRRAWDKIHAGTGNAWRTAILDNGMKYQPVAMSNTDAQFVESSEQRVADICRFFAVPLHMVYAGKQSYNSNEQNVIDFAKFTLQPLVTQREQEDTYKLLLPKERAAGARVKREMKALLRGDTAAQAAWYRAMRECGVYSVNDVNALEDLPDVPGGDRRRESLNYVPLDLWPELSQQRATGGSPEA
jgi:HK97 family phage portal protein